MGTMKRYRYNRAVGAHNKGDEFMASSSDLYTQSLLGAGYADPVLEEDDDRSLRGDSQRDNSGTVPATGGDDGTVREENPEQHLPGTA